MMHLVINKISSSDWIQTQQVFGIMNKIFSLIQSVDPNDMVDRLIEINSDEFQAYLVARSQPSNLTRQQLQPFASDYLRETIN